MMNVQMSSDITEIEPRLLFNLTKREVICLGLAGAIGFGIFSFLEKLNIKMDIKIYISLILSFPFFSIGFIKPFGMPLETFFFKCFLPFEMNPTKKYYKTHGLYDNFPEKEKMYREIPKKKMKKKEIKNYEKELEKYGGRD